MWWFFGILAVVICGVCGWFTTGDPELDQRDKNARAMEAHSNMAFVKGSNGQQISFYTRYNNQIYVIFFDLTGKPKCNVETKDLSPLFNAIARCVLIDDPQNEGKIMVHFSTEKAYNTFTSFGLSMDDIYFERAYTK